MGEGWRQYLAKIVRLIQALDHTSSLPRRGKRHALVLLLPRRICRISLTSRGGLLFLSISPCLSPATPHQDHGGKWETEERGTKRKKKEKVCAASFPPFTVGDQIEQGSRRRFGAHGNLVALPRRATPNRA